VDEQQPGENESIRELFLEVAELLEAIVIALQAERDQAEAGFVLREAVRRVVRLREHLNAAEDTPGHWPGD
jgi:hypothetical protein